MKLLTKEIEKKLEKNPLYSHDGELENAKVIVKFFNPYGIGTWLITEGEKQEDGDWLLFGYCHLYEWEWGYVSLKELEDLKINVFGQTMGIERDMYMRNATVKECI